MLNSPYISSVKVLPKCSIKQLMQKLKRTAVFLKHSKLSVRDRKKFEKGSILDQLLLAASTFQIN